MGALTFVPALAPGPVVEHLQLHAVAMPTPHASTSKADACDAAIVALIVSFTA